MSETAISNEDYRQLLVDISDWYDKRGYINMLKVLYRDHVNDNSRLNEASNMMDLLRPLIGSGTISATDLTLLYDTIEVTETFGLREEIEDKLPSYPREIVISNFTSYRQKLIKLGLVLTPHDRLSISRWYGETEFKKYADNWSLIMDLEHNMIIREGDMNKFIEMLKSKKLHAALKAVGVELTGGSIVNVPAAPIPTAFTAKVLTGAVVIVIISISIGIISYTGNSFSPSIFLLNISMVPHSLLLKEVDEHVHGQVRGKISDEFTSTAQLLWVEEVDTGISSPRGAIITMLPADPTTYAPELFATGNIESRFQFGMAPANYVALDTDYQDGVVFFSDSKRMKIFKGSIDDNISRKVCGTSKRVEDIAVDWLAKTLYIIDRWIVLYHRDNNRLVILVRDGLDKLRGVAVHPAKRLLFWSDCGKVPKIERANLDGTNRTSLITTGITSPNGLSVDYLDNRLYWTDVDDAFSKVESCDLDGANRRVLFRKPRLTSQFYKLKVHKDYVYVTDWERKLWCVHKASGDVYFMLNLRSRPHGVTMYGDGNQKFQKSPCLSNPCSQICTSTENGYKCLCSDLFHLLSDGKTCKRDDFMSTPLLLWVEEVFIGTLSQHAAKIQTLPADPTIYAPGLIATNAVDTRFIYMMSPGTIIALDTDSQDQVVLFSDRLRMGIFKGPIDGHTANIVVDGLSKKVEGIAVDWLAKTLYVIDQTYNWIFVVNYREPNRYVILLRDGLDQPCDVAVHPAKGLLFWSDCGKVPKIERANLDGTNRKSLITTDITSPNGLSVDYLDNRLYWTDVDDTFSKVESCDLNGANRRIFFREPSSTSQFYKLKVHKDYVYVTDWEHKLWCVHKASSEVYFQFRLRSRPHAVTVYGDDNQKIQQSPCLSNPCSEICTSAENGYKCLCGDSFHLLSDGKTCKQDGFFSTPQFLFANRTCIGKLHGTFPTASFPPDFVVSCISDQRYVVALQADVARHLLFYSDTVSMYSLELKDKGKPKFVAEHLGSVHGIAVDYLSQTLYWTDIEKNHIMASSYDGRYRQVLIDTDIEQPQGIVVDPIEKWIFWLDFTHNIERATLDGSDRKIIVNTQGVLCGITIDFESQRLYFGDRLSDDIQSVDYDGEARKVAFKKAGALFVDMDIFQDFLVWTEWPPNGMHVLNKETREFVSSLPFPVKAFGIITLDATRQPNGTSPCMNNNGGCEQICISGSGASPTCLCSVGYTLGEEGACNNNIIEDKFLLVADSGLKTIFQIDLSNDRDYAYTAVRMGPFQYPVAVGFDPVDRHVYVGDTVAHQILRSSLVGNNTIVIHHGAYYVKGLAVDHINRLLFWTDGIINCRIHVSKLNGTDKKILLSYNLDPWAIAVDPVRGFLFWTDKGTNPKVERSRLDGTNRRILVDTNISWPTGLSIDTKDQFIYWCDAQTKKIEKVKFDGSQRTLMKELDAPVRSCSLLVDDLYIYFTNRNGNRLMRMNKVEGDKPVAVGEGAFEMINGLTSQSFN